MRVDSQYVQSLVGSVGQIQLTQQKLTQEISTGVKVNSLSDNPEAATQDYTLRSEQATNDTYVTSSANKVGELQVADSAIGSVVTQLTQAISLTTSAGNGTLNSSERGSIALQLQGVQGEVLSLLNTTYQGQYLFAGSQTQTAPFTLNTSTVPATDTYNGDTAVRTVKTPSGQSIQTSIPGSQLFGSGATGVLGALSQAIADINAGASATVITADLSGLTSASSQVNQQRVVLDNAINQLKSSSTYTQTVQTQLQSAQDALIQTNTAQSATDLSAATTQYNALIDAISAIEQLPTLFSKF